MNSSKHVEILSVSLNQYCFIYRSSGRESGCLKCLIISPVYCEPSCLFRSIGNSLIQFEPIFVLCPDISVMIETRIYFHFLI